MKLTRDIQSLSTFKRDTAKLVRQLKKTGQPVILTVNGKAELVVQDAESYQKLLEAKDRMEAIEGIKRGLESMKRNAGKPAEKFFQELFTEKGISDREWKRYVVVFEVSAQADVRESYDWGRRIWGKHEAEQYVRQLRKAVTEQLAVGRKPFPSLLKTKSFAKRFGRW